MSTYTIGDTRITLTPFKLMGLPCQKETARVVNQRKETVRYYYSVRVDQLVGTVKPELLQRISATTKSVEGLVQVIERI